MEPNWVIGRGSLVRTEVDNLVQAVAADVEHRSA
jgi:hypothetical protein